MIDGKHIGSCLGDLFSINWLENAYKESMVVETLELQYDIVKKETTRSQALQWGDLSFTSESIGEFEAALNMQPKKKHGFWDNLKNVAKDILTDVLVDQNAVDIKNEFAVDSRDIGLHQKYSMVMKNPTLENSIAL